MDVPQKRKFLGFTFTGGRRPNQRKIAPESIQRFRSRVRRLTRRNRGVSLEQRVDELSRYLRGWIGLLWVRRKPLGPAESGQLDSSSPAQRPMETVEGLPAPPGGVDPSGCEPGDGPADRVERQGPLGPQSSARGPDSASECLLRSSTGSSSVG